MCDVRTTSQQQEQQQNANGVEKNLHKKKSAKWLLNTQRLCFSLSLEMFVVVVFYDETQFVFDVRIYTRIDHRHGTAFALVFFSHLPIYRQ